MTKIISYFPSIKATKNGKDMPVDMFLQYVKDGKWQDDVLAVRIGKKAKSDLPYVTLSGKFSERKITGLVSHSGYICMDIDDVDDPEMVKSIICVDKYVYAAFVSVSGKGLAVMFKINPDKHAEAFEGLQEYLFTQYEIVTDPSCKDVSRPRYVSYDPHIFLNAHSDRFAQYPKKQRALDKVPEVIYVQSDFDQIIRELVARRIDITGDYYQWLRIGFALSDKFGPAGRDYFHQISQFSQTYAPRIADRQYTNCLKAHKSGITIATFYYYIKQAGIPIASEQTKTISQTAYLAKKGRRSKEDTVKLLQEAEGITPEESTDIVNQVFDNNIHVDTSDSPIDALEGWLRQNYDLRRNMITRKLEDGNKEVDEEDLNTIYIAAKKLFDKDITSEIFNKLIFSRFIQDFNPFFEFFDRHKERRPSGQIDRLFDSIDSDTGLNPGPDFWPQYKSYFGKKWFVGLVSAMHGTHSPLMLVLSGTKQGTGKTEFWKRILPPELKKYFTESRLDKGKDDEILMTQKILVMIDEMSAMDEKEVAAFKRLSSKQTFSLRAPYGRHNIDLNRLAVLCATTQENEILSDPTGNRRIIPINVLAIDHEQYNSVDKVDLIMEAYHLYKEGYNWQLTTDDIGRLNKNTGDFEKPSAEYDLLIKHFESPRGVNDPFAEFLSATEIKSILEKASGQKLSSKAIGMELKKLGFERKQKMDGGIRKWGYPLIDIMKRHLANINQVSPDVHQNPF